jgi:intracellular multiplication protein IcmE
MELLSSLNGIQQTITRMALAFHYSPSYIFLENEDMFSENNKQFLIDIIKNYHIQRMDFLACNTLRDMEWKSFYDNIVSETNVILGASDNETGNIQYGGDWIMENTSEDIQSVYFNNNIVYYKHLLFATNWSLISVNNNFYYAGQNMNGESGKGFTGLKELSMTTVDPSGKMISDIVCAENYSYFTMTDGTVYAIGAASFGQIPGGTTDILKQITVPDGKTVSKIIGGLNSMHVIMLMTDNTMYGCGRNTEGQLGLNDYSSRTSFTLIPNNTGKIPYQIVCGQYHTMVLMTDGTIYGMGFNQMGQQGVNDTTKRNVLTLAPLPSDKIASQIACGQSFTIALMTDGTLYGTGYAGNGELGTSISGGVAKTFTLMTNSTGKVPSNIICGGEFTIALMTDNTIYVTGKNTNGQLGLSNTTSRSSFTLLPLPTGKTPSQIMCGFEHTIVLMTDSTMYGTGLNSSGQLGTDNTTRSLQLTIMTTAPQNKTWTKILRGYYSTFAIDNNGKTYACGRNESNCLNVNNRMYFSKVNNNTGKTISKISTGVNFAATLMTDGTVYVTGYNADGQIAMGVAGNSTSPSLIPSFPAGKTASQVSCGYFHTAILMTDGTVYITGKNNFGQIGTGSGGLNTSYNTLIEMSLPSGKLASYISCGYYQTIVAMRDGSVYGCGTNSSGQLGMGATSNIIDTLTLISSFPSGKTVSQISNGESHTIMLMTDGTIYGCGTGSRLGLLNDSAQKNSLTLMNTIPAGKTPLNIYCGYRTTFVLMTDQTLYGCGANSNGELGINSGTVTVVGLTLSNVPVDKTILELRAEGNHAILTMTDGSIYTTGLNDVYQLGLGDLNKRISFTKSTIWVDIAAPTISNFSISNKNFGDLSFNVIDPSSNSTGAFTYTSSNTSVATISGNTITIVGFGNTTITAIQQASSDYSTGSVTTTLTVNKTSAASLKTLGYTATQLKTANYTASDLKVADYTATEMKTATFTATEMKTASFTATELKIAGYTASELRTGGYTATELKVASFTTTEMKAGGYTASQMKTASFTATEMKEGGYTATEMNAGGYTATEMKEANYTATETKTGGYTASQMKTAGYTATEMKTATFTATQLKAAGYTASEMKVAEYTATEMKAASFTATELKAGGYTATEVKSGGYTASEIKTGGYSVSEMRTASYTATELKAINFTIEELKAGGYTATEMKDASYTITELKNVGYTAAELLSAGFLTSDLISAGYTALELKNSGYTVSQLQIYGFSDATILSLGYTAAELRTATKAYTAVNLKPYNYTASDLRIGGFTIALILLGGSYTRTEVATCGFTLSELRYANFTPTDLRTAGFTALQLASSKLFSDVAILSAGFTTNQLYLAGYTVANVKPYYSDANILSGGFPASQLYGQGYSASLLKQYGYTAAQLKSAGYLSSDIFALNYTVSDLNVAEFTAQELKNANYTAQQLIDGGYSKNSVINLGYTVNELKLANFTASELRIGNYSISQLKAGNYSDNEILAGGFSATNLKASGYTASQLQANNYTIQNLKDASYSAVEIITAGYSASLLRTNGYLSQQLKNNGFTVSSLINGGYSTADILSVGFSADELRSNNYTVSQLQTYNYTALSVKTGGYLDSDILSGGFSATQLKDAGYSATQLRTNGYTVDQLKTALYSNQSILSAGFSSTELRNASYTASQLKQYNYTVNDLRTASYPMTDIISLSYSADQLLPYYTAFQIKTYYTASQLKAGGYSDNDILSASISSSQLRQAGFTASQLRQNNYTISDLVTGLYTTSQILSAGYSSSDLKGAGYSATQLRQNSYTISNLLDAGYTNNEILAAGYTSTELKNANYTASDLYNNNYTALQLKTAGYNDSDILNLGYNISQLKTAGYQPTDLKNIYSDIDILSSSFSASSLKQANYAVSDLKEYGYTVAQLKSAEYLDSDILSSGFSATQLKQNNYSSSQLKDYNYTANDLKQAGYTVAELQTANYTTEDILSLDYLASQLKLAGYTSTELKTYFYTALELKLGGYTDEEILTIGYTVNELTIAGYNVDQMRLNGYTDNTILTGISSVLDTLPNPPIITSFTTSNSKAFIYFSDLSNNDIPVIGYKYTLDNGENIKWFRNNINPLELFGLTNGESYNIGIYAVNRNGTSSISNIVENVVPFDVPDKPFILNGISSNGTLIFEFIPGNNNGSNVTEYYYSVDNINYILTEPSGNNIIVNGLSVNQTYDITLKTKNAKGLSTKSNTIQIEITGTMTSPIITDISSNDGIAQVYYTIDSSLNDIYYKYSLNNNGYYYFKNRENPLLLPDLSLNNTYNIKMKAEHYIYGESNESNSLSFTTKAKPSKSVILSANYSNNLITLDIIEGENNGSPIQYYYYSLNDSSYSIVDNISDSVITIRTIVDINQTNNIKITSNNLIGMSDESNTRVMTYEILPDPPIIDYVVPNNKMCSIYFINGNLYNASLICYKYKLSNSDEVRIVKNVENPLVITDLSNNTQYNVKIKTVTESGTSVYSNLSEYFTPFGIPSAPVITSIEPRFKAVIVNFNMTDNGGSEIIGYKYSLNNGELIDASSNQSPITISNLENKISYAITIYSYNKAGLSLKSNTITCIPGTPSAPIINSIVSADSAFAINYTQSAITNGSSVTQMYYTFDGIKLNAFASMVSPLLIKNVINGIPYNINIVSMNANGFSPLSNSVTGLINIPPGRPTITSVNLFFETMTTCYAILVLGTPITNGLPITKYLYALGSSNTYTDISGNASPIRISNLPINTSFTIKLIAANIAGNSSASLSTRSLTYILNVPGRPTIKTVTTSLNTMSVSFVAPPANGTPITSYKYSLNDQPYIDISSNSIPMLIPIENNVSYSVKIIAVNMVGDSLPSAAFSKLVSFIYLAPLPPKINSITRMNESLYVNFTASRIRGAPVTSYSYSLDGGVTLVDTNSLVTPIIITGLTNGTNYSVSLYANSLAGMSTASNVIIASPILAEPGAPVVSSITPLNNSCSVTFATPVENGSPITTYLYSLDGGNTLTNTGSSSTTILITGLVNGTTYNIQFIAVNAIGNSPLSIAKSVIPIYDVPSAPTITKVTPGIKSATVSFTAATPNGSSVKAYYYSVDNGDTLINANKLTSSIVISNLTSFLTYTITLYAENDVGYSVASNALTVTIR